MIEVEHEGKKWTPLRTLCEKNGIGYRYRSKVVLGDENVETAILMALCRKGKQKKMICIPVEKISYVLSMERPGRGCPNRKRGPRLA
jgi:hypothetical protein